MTSFAITRALTGLPLLVLLAGCTTGFSLTPEQLARNVILETHRGQTSTVDPSSVQVLQSQQLDQTVLVLSTYQELDEDGRRMRCTELLQTHRMKSGLWAPDGGGSGCSGGSAEPAPLTDLFAGQSARSNNPGAENLAYSDITGLVNQPEIIKVRVLWDDGQTQTVDVVNNSFLAIRDGEFQYTGLEALDQQGAVVYTYQQPEIAPGKMPRGVQP